MKKVLSNDWRVLSQAASREQDPIRLMELIEQLNRVLEERERAMRETRVVRNISDTDLLSA
jgi:hypothetical protein